MNLASGKRATSFTPTLILLLAIMMAASGAVHGQTISNTPRPEMWVTDGTVNSLVESCGLLAEG